MVSYDKGLLSLPTDILRTLLDLPDIGILELGALAVTCRQLYYLCEKIIRECQEESSARWRYCRIACIGDYAQYEDLPASLLNDGDRARIEAEIKLGSEGYMGYAGIGSIATTEGWVWRGSFSYQQSADNARWMKRFTPADRKMFLTVLGIVFPPERNDWVLCNHTKRQYVRASTIAKLSGYPDDPQPFLPNCRVDLGHALLTRICWSTSDDIAISRNPTKLHRGLWVGDRFSVTTLDRCVPVEGRPEWTDVSDEVARDLIQIYRAEYGKEWLQSIEEGAWPVDYHECRWFASDGDDDVARRGRYTRARRPSI